VAVAEAKVVEEFLELAVAVLAVTVQLHLEELQLLVCKIEAVEVVEAVASQDLAVLLVDQVS
jgi:hypothetical protein